MNHTPVLIKESIEFLKPEKGGIILDATIDGGGHAEAIMQKIGKTGTLIGIDQDAEMLDRLNSKIQNPNSKLILINGNFRDIDVLVEPYNIKKINGVLFDLGLSSAQLEESGRGFTFQKDEPLLMTYKSDINGSDLTAKDIVNAWSERDIADVIFKYGEERYGRRIAKRIAAEREKKEIGTTFDLRGIIENSVPPSYRRNRKINCCTRTFQALRIAVNDELEAIKEGIEKAWNLLADEGRIAVISFHSLEDRIIKNFMREKAEQGRGIILTKKPVTASQKEINENPRSRSAKLRAIKRITSNG